MKLEQLHVFWCATMWFGLSSYRCGLFGLTDLETSKFRNHVTRDTKWSQQWRKIINFSHWASLAFKMTFRNFFGLFWFLWPCWCLLRPLKSKRFNFYQITHLWNFWTNLAQSSHSVRLLNKLYENEVTLRGQMK